MKIQFCDSDIIQLISLSEVVVGLQVKYVELSSEGSFFPLVQSLKLAFSIVVHLKKMLCIALGFDFFSVCISFVLVVT